MVNYYSLIPLSAFIFSGFIWVFIFAKKSNSLNNAFLIFAANLLVWELSTYLCIAILPESLIIIAFKLASISWFLIGVLFLNFTFVFINRKRDKLFHIFSLMSVIAIIISLNSDLIVKGYSHGIHGNIFSPGILYIPLVLLTVLIPVIYSIIILIKVYITSTDKMIRTSLFLLLFGIIISTINSSLINIFLPHFFNIYIFAPYESSNSLILLIFVFRAILKYNFLSLTEEEVTISLLSNLKDGVILTDNYNSIIQINNSAKLFFNISSNPPFKDLSINSLINNYVHKFEEESDMFYFEMDIKQNKFDKRIFEINYSKVYKGSNPQGKIFTIRDITLSVTAEEVLKKSKNDLKRDVEERTIELTEAKNHIESIYNSISESIVTINEEYKILDINNSFKKLYYFTENEIFGKDISTIFADKEFHNIQVELKNLEYEKVLTFESNNLKKDFTTFPVSISAVKMQKQSTVLSNKQSINKNFQIILSIIDMTEKKIIEAKMRDSRNKARMVIQNINESIFVIQNNYIKYFINTKIEKILDYSLNELISIPFHNFIHPEDINIVNNIFNNISKKANESKLDETFSGTIISRIISSSGKIKWVEINAILKRWNNEPAFLIYLTDITERKIAEINLSENENQFRAFIDQANDFIIIKDLEGRYLKANKKFCELIKVKEEDLIGKSPSELGYSKEFIEKANAIDNEIIKSKKIIVENNRASKSSAAGTKWLEVTTFPILDNKNEVKYIGVLSRDITNQKNWEEKLSAKHEQLQQAHGDLKKSHEIIVKQEKLASLGTMAAGIAHEINNPAQVVKFSMQSLNMNIKDISKIIDSIYELKKESDPLIIEHKFKNLFELMDYLDINIAMEELKKTSNENIKSIERIEHIIKSTKRMAYTDLEFTDCNINDIVKDSLTLVENNVKYNVNITKSLAPEIPIFKGISSEITQIIINLVNNSKDSIVEKGLSKENAVIFVTTKFNTETENIEIVIEDNGNGISDDAINKIYDPFFTTKGVGKGTGLGLNIVHRIITAHRGEIKVKSKQNVGSKFKITIPINQRDNKL